MMKARKLAKKLNGHRVAVTASPRKPASMGPTPERLSKILDAEIAADGPLKGRVRVKSVMERLRDRKVITPEMYHAGEKYFKHWVKSGAYERYAAVRMDGAPSGGSTAASENAVYHQQKYTEAVRKLGVTLSRVVEDVVCRDVEVPEVVIQRWRDRAQSNAAGTALLCVGLEKLVDLWGLA